MSERSIPQAPSPWPEPTIAGGWSRPYYATGLRSLDEHTAGLGTGELWVITSAPGQGRSVLLTQIACHVATSHQLPTWLVASRDPAHVVSGRVHSQLGRIPLSHLAEDRLTDLDRSRLGETRRQLQESPFRLLAGLYAAQRFGSGAELEPRSPQAVFFDDPTWQPGWDLQQARDLADSGATVVVTLPRTAVLPGAAFRCDVEPQMILADVVLEVRLHNLAAAGADHPDGPGLAAIAVLRNRRGPHSTFTVLFQGHVARFVDDTP